VSGPLPSVRTMLIDCDSCTARPRACGDCIVTHLLSVEPSRPSARGTPDDHDGWDTADAPDVPDEHRPTELTPSEIAAVGVLSAGGLVPPLRLVTDPSRSVTTRQAPRGAGRGGLGSGTQAG
jgi:hypothetical protein